MTPEFSKAVDPIFMHVLGLLERIGRNENPPPENERLRIRGWIDQAEGQLGRGSDWQLAKYALVAWIDDKLIDAPWEGREWWKENALEVEIFKTRLRHKDFYVKAEEAFLLPKKDALETFYVCAVLGFRGLYRDPAGAALAESLKLPGDLEAWARKAEMAIRLQLGQGRPPIAVSSQPIQGAQPLDGPFILVFSLVWAMLLSAATGILAYVLYLL